MIAPTARDFDFNTYMCTRCGIHVAVKILFPYRVPLTPLLQWLEEHYSLGFCRPIEPTEH